MQWMYQKIGCVSGERWEEPERWDKIVGKCGKSVKSVSIYDKETIKWTEGIAMKKIIEDKAIFLRRGEQRLQGKKNL